MSLNSWVSTKAAKAMVERKRPVDGSARIGAMLMQLRKSRRMTRRQLAQAVGITQRMVSYYERGRIRMSIERLQQFATALDCQVSDLVIHPPAEP
jgi:transcriptional regulator with XRE-family HTH domain